MNTASKESIPTQTPSHNGHSIELEEVITTAIEVEGLIARTLLQLHARFARHHEATFVFAKMAGTAAAHEAELQRRWTRLKTTPQAYGPIASQVGSLQQTLMQTLQRIGDTLLGQALSLCDALQMCFQIIDEEEQVVEALITSMGSPNLFVRTVIDGMPCYKNQDYKAGLFALARREGLLPCEWADLGGVFSTEHWLLPAHQRECIAEG